MNVINITANFYWKAIELFTDAAQVTMKFSLDFIIN